MEIKTLISLIDERKNELFRLLSDLIKINSESFSSYGKEEECAKYIHKLCLDMGLESELYSPLDIKDFTNHSDYMPGRGLENRYNVSATYKGKSDSNGLMIMGHTDTVAIGDVSKWDRDPLSGEISDGKIHGRGACDDKYALAASLFIIKLLRENGFVPKENLVFAAYSDEEYGGSHGALAAVLHDRCENIVNLDCEAGIIWHCGTGGGEVKYNFHTKDIADSAEKCARAIGIVMDELEKFKANRCAELSANKYYKGTIIPETSLRYMGVKAGSDGSDLGDGFVYFVYYTDKTKAEIDKEFEALHEIIKERLDNIGVVGEGFVPNTRFFHYVHTEPDSNEIKLLLECAKEVGAGEIQVVGSCLSDLSVISKFGSSRAFGYGAGINFSKVGGAHQPNEYIECDEFLGFTKTVAAYILKTLG